MMGAVVKYLKLEMMPISNSIIGAGESATQIMKIHH